LAATLRTIVRDICPPLIWRAMSQTRTRLTPDRPHAHGVEQDLGVYWDAEMAQVLETWGDGTTWNEILLLMAAREGKALDIACGTGKVMAMLAESPRLQLFGCDISDMLIGKAVQRGLAPDSLKICDATQMPYGDDEFDFSYSIGSLEHFTIEGIGKVIAEAARTTKTASFHMLPTARSERDEGWMKTYQSFHNCSVGWWIDHFEKSFRRVRAVDSRWQDRISVGKWFVCSR
jgi:ubiquinone/menaquinone biosynthesis C-methylase UbiE